MLAGSRVLGAGRRAARLAGLLAVLCAVSARAGLDRNGNGLDDVWELLHGASALVAADDADGDGASNGEESAAGTDPWDPESIPLLLALPSSAVDALNLRWTVVPGKVYALLSLTNLLESTWAFGVGVPESAAGAALVSAGAGDGVAGFYRLRIGDADADGDGLTDYAERALAFDPATSNTARYRESDYARVTNSIGAPSVITAATLDPWMHEGWPEPGLVAVRRQGGLAPLTLMLAHGGAATLGQDYTCSATGSVFMPAGVREVWLEFTPLADAVAESAEGITVTVLPGSGYSVGSSNVAALTLEDAPPGGGPGVKEAARFLIQAAFGPDADDAGDADDVPENVESVMAMGFSAWLDDQFTRPVGWHRPMAEWLQANRNALQVYNDMKVSSWWGRAMGTPTLTPDDPVPQLPDPLRQRMAFALSEILVISDRPETLGVQPVGMTDYYDVLVAHAFGNYGDLLLEVALHPCMGTYLSHIGNRKADPANNIFPDENFAREVMQLFAIGLWQLNPDGTRTLDEGGQPIPTYTNDDITELARVFTGQGMGGSNNTFFAIYPPAFTDPMSMWDAHHDCEPKTLLGGLVLPARTPSAGRLGTAGHADVAAAISNLFHHANVGPFIGRQLIQRFVTSNPSTGYVARVAAVFADNGSGERGDLSAVLRAILLDPEARDHGSLADPAWGKLREPFLRVVNLARAFNAVAPCGFYPLDAFDLDHAQMPLNSPSVFNFFLPTHSPPGPITQAGLVAPEFQIVNASTAISADNYFWNCIWNGLNRWGYSNPDYRVGLVLDAEMALVVPPAQAALDVPPAVPYDPDALIRRLDLVLTGGTLAPWQYQSIRETLARIPRPSWQWHRQYLRTAIYLVVSSPEFGVLR